MEPNQVDGIEDGSSAQQGVSIPGRTAESGSSSIMSQISRQTNQQSDQPQDSYVYSWSSTSESMIDRQEENRDSLILEEETDDEDTTGDIYVFPSLKMIPPKPVPTQSCQDTADKPSTAPPPVQPKPTSKQSSPDTAEEHPKGTAPPPVHPKPTPRPVSQDTAKEPSTVTAPPPVHPKPTPKPGSQDTAREPSTVTAPPPVHPKPTSRPVSQDTAKEPSTVTSPPPVHPKPTPRPGSQDTAKEPSTVTAPPPVHPKPTPKPGSQDTAKEPSTVTAPPPVHPKPTSRPVSQDTAKEPSTVTSPPPVHPKPTPRPGSQDTAKEPSTVTAPPPVHPKPTPRPGSQNTAKEPSTVTAPPSEEEISQLDGFSNIQSQGGNVGIGKETNIKPDKKDTHDVMTEESKKLAVKFLSNRPQKFLIDGRSMLDHLKSDNRTSSRSVETVTPRRSTVDSQTLSKDISSGVITEDRKSVKDLANLFQKPEPPTGRVSRSLSPQRSSTLFETRKGISETSSPTEDISKSPSLQKDSISPVSSDKNTPETPDSEIDTSTKTLDMDKDTLRMPGSENDTSTKTLDVDIDSLRTSSRLPIELHEDMDEDRDNEEDYETAEEDEMEDQQGEQTGTVVVSAKVEDTKVSPLPPQLAVIQLESSSGMRINDSMQSNVSAGLGSDMIGCLTRTCKPIDSESKDQSHSTLCSQPAMSQDQPTDVTELQHQQGNRHGSTPSIGDHSKQIELSQQEQSASSPHTTDQKQDVSFPNAECNTQKIREQFQRQIPADISHKEPFQGHKESPQVQHFHQGQSSQEQPMYKETLEYQNLPAEYPQSHYIPYENPQGVQPLNVGPYQSQRKEGEYHHQAVYKEQFDDQREHQHHPTRPQYFYGQEYPQQQHYPWQQVDEKKWHGGGAGYHGNIHPQHQWMYDPQYYYYYSQPGTGQAQKVDKEPFHQGPGAARQHPHVSQPQHKESPKKPGANVPMKAKKKNDPPSHDDVPQNTDKMKKNEEQKKIEKSYVCVKGLAERTGLDALCLYLEIMSGCEVDKSSIIYTSDKSLAVASLLQNPKDFEEFQRKCRQRKLEGAEVKVCMVPPPVTVVVSSEQSLPSDKALKEHFQKEKFGRVKVKRIELTDDGCCRVEFKDNAAFENVCNSPYSHRIGSTNLCVTTLYECEFGEIWEVDKHKVCIPEATVLKHTNYHKMMMVIKYQTMKDLLESRLKPKHAKLKVTDEIYVECTMDQSTTGVRHLVQVWEDDVKEIWNEFINVTVKQIEMLVTAEVWSVLFNHVKEHQEHTSVHLDFTQHQDNVRLVVVGVDSMFHIVTKNLQEHRERIENAIERKKQITTVTKTFKPLEIQLLRRLDTLTQVNSLVEDLNVTANTEMNSITFNGIMDDIHTAQIIIGEEVQQFRFWTIQEDNVLNQDQVKLLQKDQVLDILKTKFAQQQLVVEFDCETDRLEVGTVSTSARQHVTQIITDSVLYSDVPLVDREKIEVLSITAWKRQCHQIEENNSDLVVISNVMDHGFTVTSIETIHQDILRQLLTFIDEHAKYKDTYDLNDKNKMKFFKKHFSREVKPILTDLSPTCDSMVIEDMKLALTGTSEGIRQAKKRLRALENRIKSKQHDIQKLGIGTVICNNDEMFSGIETDTTTVVTQHEAITHLYSRSQVSSDDDDEEDLYGTEEGVTWGRTGKFGATSEAAFTLPQPTPIAMPTQKECLVTCKNGLKIKLRKGEIGTEKADVLVVSVSNDLTLDKSAAGKSLEKYGGTGLQAEIRANFSGTINCGDIITIGPGTLRCKKVFLSSLPEWLKDKKNDPMVITKVIMECLNKAGKAGYNSIKFIAMGTGASKYPPQTVAEAMYDAVRQFDAKGTTSVLVVTFVLYSKDRCTISAFEDEEYKQMYPGAWAQTGPSGPFDTKHGIKITLVKDLIDNQSVDVIACATAKNLDMSGAVATAISKAAGPAILKAECNSKFPSGIQYGELAVLTNGNLKTCKSIYLTSLPDWKTQDSSKLANTAITACLQNAHNTGMKSIAFPAFGTGQIGYPHDKIANLMYNCVIDFAKKNTNSSVTDVRFVLHKKDRELIMSFEKEVQMRLSKPYSSGPSKSFYTKASKVQVSIETGSIADFKKADVIAVTVSEDLDITKGGAMAALASKAGVAIKTECNTKYPKGIKIGDLAEISPGNLSCKALYLGTLPTYSSGAAAAEKALDKYIRKVLDTAASKGYSSVVFPAVGTGFNKYPHNRAATQCYEAVQHFDKKSNSIKIVYFAVLQKDVSSLQAFQREERKRRHFSSGVSHFPAIVSDPMTKFGDSRIGATGIAKQGTRRRVFSKRDEDDPYIPKRHTTKSKGKNVLRNEPDQLGPNGGGPVTLAKSSGLGLMSTRGGNANEFVYGKVTLKINVENIVSLKTAVDVIVNSTNKDLDFTKGAISQNLMKVCDSKQLSDECDKLKTDMKKEGLVCTSGCGLSCKAILHLDAQTSLKNWQKMILACLQEVDRRGHTSVAFPAVGTAGGTVQFKPEEIAEVFHNSLLHFSGSNVTFVRLVIFEPEMLWSMTKVFRNNTEKQSTSVPEDIGAVLGGRPPADLSHVSLWILGTSDNNIDDAIERIKILIDRKYSVKPFRDTLVSDLNDNEVKGVEKLSKKDVVRVKVNKQSCVVEVEGPLEEVDLVTQELYRLFRHFQKERHFESEAAVIAEMVQWYYKELDQGVPVLSAYPPRVNMGLENSWKGKFPKFCFRANNQKYEVSLLDMKEYSVDDPTDTADVIRREKVEGAMFELPTDWVEMGGKEIVKLIPLAASSQEYKDRETMFTTSVLKGQYKSQFNAAKLKVHKIERIQNPSLFQQYSMKKAQLEQKNPQGTSNEQMLWHGTGQKAITSINYYGFNRSYCGSDASKGGCWYGAGVYFANDASYSARDWVSPPVNQKKSIYLCRVLTGVYCEAFKDMKYLPSLPQNPSENYDCAVKPLKNPLEFVIFNDTQAYPEHLLTFSIT